MWPNYVKCPYGRVKLGRLDIMIHFIGFISLHRDSFSKNSCPCFVLTKDGGVFCCCFFLTFLSEYNWKDGVLFAFVFCLFVCITKLGMETQWRHTRHRLPPATASRSLFALKAPSHDLGNEVQRESITIKHHPAVLSYHLTVSLWLTLS